eukprot:TRINITY_DN1453_c0_g1_i2.p1 TRINITY_DN1453_c0_g1~~TRINITY_DN1453_c0_g1_i2.p1  ORF type:complete len:653 (+),score=300.55 TRINITY_DN1453_c0_g1_i2:107-1960(+)
MRDEAHWEEVQKNAFRGWVNMHLEKRDMRVDNLNKDFADGVKLINLIEILHGQKIEGRYYKNPKSRPYRIDNVNFALTYITDTIKIKLFGCSAEDIVDGNLKIILGMLWRLIQRYQLSDQQNRQSLLAWCRTMTNGFDGVVIDNLHDGFADGLAFGALLSVYDPKIIEYSSLKGKPAVENLERMFSLAGEHMGVPKLLNAKDVAEHRTDERSLLTYISMWNDAFRAKSVVKADLHAAIAARTSGSDEGSGDASSALAAEVESLQKVNAGLREDLEYVREELAMARTALSKAEEATKEAKEALEAEKKNRAEAGADDAAQSAAAASEVSDAELSEKVSEKRAELEKITKELESVDAKLQDAVDMEAAATKQAENVNREMKETTEKLDEVQKELAAKQEELDVLNGKIADATPKEAPRPVEPTEEAAKKLKEIETKITTAEDELKKKERQLEVAIKEVNAVTAARSMTGHSMSMSSVKPDEELQQALEDAKEEILVLKKKYERAQAKALKKQKKKYEGRVKKRDKDLKEMREQADIDLKAKSDEIAILRTQLSKAQRALGEATGEGDAVPVEDLQQLQDAYAEMLGIARMLEEEENLARNKQRAHANSDSEGEDDLKDD